MSNALVRQALLDALASHLRAHPGLWAKREIAAVASALGIGGASDIPVGDDCAAIPARGGGYDLFAIEGFMAEFVAADPWFAGWCGVMVNVSDVAAMGGHPVAVVDALWALGGDGARLLLEGLSAAAAAYGVPVVGGHSNLRGTTHLAVAILGRADRLLTSFDARPGEVLVAAIDLRGRYRPSFSNWDAATGAPHERLRGDIALLPAIAAAGLARAAKDISQAGLVGTAVMLAECSQVAILIDVDAIPRPNGIALDRWLTTFPSFGFLLSVRPEHVAEVLTAFRERDIAANPVGRVEAGSKIAIASEGDTRVIWDHALDSLTGCTPSLPAGGLQ